MKDKSSAVTTDELWGRLFSAPNADAVISGSSDDYSLPAFSEFITGLCRERDEKPEQIIRRGDIESSYGHRIFSGSRNPSRDTVLQLAFGFGMDTDDTQQLLKIARQAALHPKVKRDAVIAFCLHNNKTITETQQYLYDNSMPLIGKRSHG